MSNDKNKFILPDVTGAIIFSCVPPTRQLIQDAALGLIFEYNVTWFTPLSLVFETMLKPGKFLEKPSKALIFDTMPDQNGDRCFLEYYEFQPSETGRYDIVLYWDGTIVDTVLQNVPQAVRCIPTIEIEIGFGSKALSVLLRADDVERYHIYLDLYSTSQIQGKTITLTLRGAEYNKNITNELLRDEICYVAYSFYEWLNKGMNIYKLEKCEDYTQTIERLFKFCARRIKSKIEIQYIVN